MKQEIIEMLDYEGKTKTMTRSPGTTITVGALPFVVGGGYQGVNKELDQTVKQAAKLLLFAFGQNVEIRFNSDRKSGGAWLKDNLPGFLNKSCHIGVTASLYPAWPARMHSEDKWAMSVAEVEAIPKRLVLNIYAQAAVLPPFMRLLATNGLEDKPYAYIEAPDVATAIAWLVQNVDRKAVPK